VSVHTALKHLRLDKQANKGSLTIQDLIWYSEDFPFDQILWFIPASVSWAIFRFTNCNLHFLDSEFVAITIPILEKIRIQRSYQMVDQGAGQYLTLI